MVTLEHTLRMLKTPIMEDGKISLGETSVLMRAIQPFAVRGNGSACELRDLLLRVRKDGVVTREESERIVRLLDQITMGSVRLDQYVFAVPDYPSPGVLFRDVSRFMDTPWLFKMVLEMIEEKVSDIAFDLVAAPEPRGIVFGAALAARRKCGFVPIHAGSKLPRETLSESYESAIGPRELAMHEDAVMRGERVLIVDDVLATGGTAAAMARLVQRAGGKVVKMAFAVELEGYKAREGVLKGFDISTLIKDPGK